MTARQWAVTLFILASWLASAVLMWRSNWENDEDWR